MNITIGVGVYLTCEGKFLTLRRLGKTGHKLIAIPGGKVEFGETLEECAKREVFEEVGITISKKKKLFF